MEESISIHSSWLEKKHEEDLMKRLNKIVSGNGDGPYKKESGYAWQLDGSDNWWAEVRGDKLILASRYRYEKFTTFVEFCKVWLS